MLSKLGWVRWSLTVKITALFVAIVIVSVGSITLMSIEREQRNFRTEQEQQATSMLDGVAASSVDVFYFFDVAQLRTIARNLNQSNPIISRVRFYDNAGRVLVETYTDREIGRVSTSAGGSDNAPFAPTSTGIQLVASDTIVFDWYSDQLIAGRSITAGDQRLGAVWVEISTSRLDEKLATIRNQGVAVAIIVIILGSATGVLLSRSILQPVRELAKASRAIAEGDLNQQVIAKSDDELAVLANSFNEMVVKLRETITELQELNVELDQRVAERTAELTAINEELRSFSYSVSHDLRAPLRSINGFSKRVIEKYGDLLPDDGKNYLERVQASSVRMGQLIDDLLSLSRVGQTKMQFLKVNLTEVATSIMSQLTEQDSPRAVQFEAEKDIIVTGDPALLKIALVNLLDNAWKYTRDSDPAEIQFGTTTQDGKTAYYVKDNGVGFDMKYADKLFGAFQRLHDAREYEGTGIGLATVKRIISRHRGDIWAEATVDKGATFFFTVPGGKVN